MTMDWPVAAVIAATCVVRALRRRGLPTRHAINSTVKKSKFFNLQDTLGVYLFFVKEYLNEGELAPAEIITPKIKNIILNKRKQELIKQFEKDILQDAIKSKTFETY